MSKALPHPRPATRRRPKRVSRLGQVLAGLQLTKGNADLFFCWACRCCWRSRCARPWRRCRGRGAVSVSLGAGAGPAAAAGGGRHLAFYAAG
ncbi:MAG: hypothetical protein WKG07_40950 [Hymenobacter sp.]